MAYNVPLPGDLSLRTVLFALTAVLLVVQGCQRPTEPEFLDLENVKLKGAKRDGTLVITADARFYNPNGFGLKTTGLDFDAFIDERHVAIVQQTVSTEVPARSEFVLPVEINVPLKKVYEDLGDLLGGLLSRKKQEVRLRLEGKILVEALGVELVVPFRHEETREIDL